MKRISGVILAGVGVILCCTGCFAQREQPTEPTETTTTQSAPTTTLPSVALPTQPSIPAGTTAPLQGTPEPVGFGSFPATGYATDSLNVRRDASTEYMAIGGLYAGEELTVLGRTGDWYEIRFSWKDENNQMHTSAFVNAQYISSVRAGNPTVTGQPGITAPTVD